VIFFEWAYFSPFRKWIIIGERLLDECGTLPVGEVEQRVTSAMFTALMQGQPDHPRIGEWAARLFALLHQTEDDNQRLMMGTSLFIYYAKWLGEHARAGIIADMLRPPPERTARLLPMPRIMLAMIDCTFRWNRYEIPDAIQAIRDGMGVAEQAGVHVWDFLLNIQPVYAALSAGACEQADPYLERMKEMIPRRGALDQSHYHYLSAWRAMLDGNSNQAMEHLGRCFTLVNERSGPMQHALTCIAAAQVRHALGEDHGIPSLLAYARKMAQGIGSALLEFLVCYSEAAFALDGDDDAACLPALAKAMALADRHDYLNFVWCLPSVMERLCIKAMETDIETNFVRKLIRIRHIVPDIPPVHLERWPWPLRVYTFGRFKLVKDDISLNLSRKTQRKPLEMLKALIALGGQQVPESRLSDALWLHADGDSAHSSFTTTLSRLRKLLGDELLYFRDGRLTLDARRCWVDVRALQRALGEALDVADADRSEALARKAIDLYRGPFLDGEDDAPWLGASRGRMRKQLVQAVAAEARRLTESGNEGRAIALCQKVIVADPATQSLFEQLKFHHFRALQRMMSS